MSIFTRLLKDPPPAWAFEISESGIAFSRTAAPEQMSFRPLAEGVIAVSPMRDNIQDSETLVREVASLVGPGQSGRSRRVALILPDYAARVSVLDFDAFPADVEEQKALIRFRMRKAVPFDLESAMISHHAQRAADGTGRIDVVVALMALEIVARYEAPFRAAGFQPGEVTTSSLAALNLVSPNDVTILAKYEGRTLAVCVLKGSTLKLARCVELDSPTPDEVASILHPTVAFIEDELKARPKRLVVCGLGSLAHDEAGMWHAEWGVEVEPLRSRFGTPAEGNAGLLGYLEAMAA